MSVRQYIGARYVTKVYENSLDPSSAEWESGVTYEPLTLVTYNYSSYLSKKAVPASIGNPASNPTYWVVTGAYNGQIAQIQADIAELQRADLLVEDEDITAKLTNNDNLYLRKGIFTISDNVNYHGHIIIDPDAIIDTDGNTLVFESDSSIEAGTYQIFDISSDIEFNDMRVYPEWFGAKNDGVTDSYQAIQKTIDSINKCVVILQPGKYGTKDSNHVWQPSNACYLVSSPIVFNKGYSGLICETQSAVIYKTNGNVLKIGNFDSESRLEKITVENILCNVGTDHLNNVGDNVSHYAVYFRRCETGRFSNLRVIGSNNGFVFQGCVGGIFEFFAVTPSIDDSYGRYYWIDNSITNASITLRTCKGSHASTASRIYGIYIDNAGSSTNSGSDLHFIECEFAGVDYGIFYDNTNGTYASNIVFDACVLDVIYSKLIKIVNAVNPSVRGMIHFNNCWLSLLTGTTSIESAIEINSSYQDFTVGFNDCHINDPRTDDAKHTIESTTSPANLTILLDNVLFSHAFHAIKVACNLQANNVNFFDSLGALSKDYYLELTGNANLTNCIFRQASGTASLQAFVRATNQITNLIGITFLGTYTDPYSGGNVRTCISSVQAVNKVWLP